MIFLGTMVLIIVILCIAGMEIFKYGLITLSIVSTLEWLGKEGEVVQSRELKRSEHKCPHCGSKNINVQPLITSAITGTIIAKNVGVGTTNIESKKIAICQDCGTDFNYITQSDIEMIQAEKIRKLKTQRIITVLLVVITVIVYANVNQFLD